MYLLTCLHRYRPLSYYDDDVLQAAGDSRKLVDRLYSQLDVASSATSSVEMRLASCQLIVMNADCLLLLHLHSATGMFAIYTRHCMWLINIM